MEERRRYERFALELPAQVKVLNSGRERADPVLNLLTRDICAGGAYLEGAGTLPAGTRVALDIVLRLERLKKVDTDRAMVHVRGEVVRLEDSTGMAICFDNNYHIQAL